MNYREIIKGLKHLRTSTLNGWREKKITEKDLNTISYALDLINRQQAEIERLTQENNALNGNTEKYIVECERRSRQIAEDYREETKSEAVREFAEKLKEVFTTIDGTFECWEVEDHIDNLVKEMTEGENGNNS